MKKLLSMLLTLLILIVPLGTKVMAELTINPNEITIVQDEQTHDLKFIVENNEYDPWLALLAESGTINFINYEYSISIPVFQVTGCDNIIKESDYVYIPGEYIDENIYSDYYDFQLIVNGYETVDDFHWSNSIVGKDKIQISDNDVIVTELNDGKISITSNTINDYANNIYEVFFTSTGDERHISRTVIGELNEFFSYENDSVIIDPSIISVTNGQDRIRIFNNYYSNINIDITLEHQTTQNCPEFNTNIDSNGDLIITSENTDWIDGLVYVEQSRTGLIGLDGSANIENIYYGFGDSNVNSYNRENSLIKIDDNTVVYSAERQRNADSGQIINNIEYSVKFISKGFTVSEEKTITFTNARKHIPSGTTANLVGRNLFIKSNDTDFIDSVRGLSVFLDPEHPKYSLSEELFNGQKIDDNTLMFCVEDDCNMNYFVVDSGINFWTDEYVGAWGVGGENDWVYLTTTPYTVTFAKGDDSASGSMNPYPDGYGGSLQLPESNFTAPNGKEFKGWKVGDDNEVKFVKEKVFIIDDTTITALWKNIPTPQKVDVASIINASNNVQKVNVTGNTMNATLNNANCESLLEDGEKAAGATVWMETAPIDNTDDGYRQLDRAVALESGGQLLECLEINLFKKVGSNNAEKIAETPAGTKALISLDLTGKQDLIDKAVRGELYVYNIHNGRVSDLITGTYDASSHIFSFAADEFSVYGLVYIENTNTGGGPSTRSNRTYNIPKTGVR